jgi:GT2 family glycosyltransferase
MKENRWAKLLENTDKQICLYICRKYYRNLDKGAMKHFYTNPLVYLGWLFRLFVVFLQLISLQKKSFAYYSYYNEQSSLSKLKGRVRWFFGLNKFVQAEFTPNYYAQAVPVEQLRFNPPNSPKVSIVIPVYNQLQYTLTCLRSIYLNVDSNLLYEVLVLNDCSNDQTAEIIGHIPGLRLINNTQNLGFLRSCNQGIAAAKGEYIFLINNDTILSKNCLESLLATIEADNKVGLVGSKLIYPNGLLQEAGGIVFSDASGYNFGNYRNADNFAYNYLREVDYCTGTSILFRRDDFMQLEGFDERFVPAYYEETDFCFSLRYRLYKKIVYQPLSVMVHFEGVSNGKKPGKNSVKQHEPINRAKFLEKWTKELTEHHQESGLVAAQRYLPNRKIVVLEEFFPRFDKDSGSYRLFHLLKLFQQQQLQLVYIPKAGQIEQPYYDILRNMGIQVVVNSLGYFNFRSDIKKASANANFVWACRPKVNLYFRFIKRKCPKVRWIYDTVDLHFVRLAREAELNNSSSKRRRAAKYKRIELELAKWANTTVCITETEEQVLHSLGIKNTVVIPNIHEIPKSPKVKSFAERKDLLFVGSYDHTPNVDAACWLCAEIMPLVWKEFPEIKVHLVGTNPRQEILNLASNRVMVHGYVQSLDDIFNDIRVFVAPLRFGAGMKGKIGQAMSYGLPTVTTTVGAEGMGITHQQEVLIADDKDAIAQQILAAYQDEQLWNQLRVNALKKMSIFSPEEVNKTLAKILN